MAEQLIGLFGGTFDPIHTGHLNVIDELCEHVNFDQIYWVLSARPPHKQEITANIEQRFEMLSIALNETQKYIADRTEINRPERSYTIDTVEQFIERFPSSNIILIIGADSLKKLPTWHRYQELIEKINIITLNRPGYKIEIPEELVSKVVAIDELTGFRSSKLAILEHTKFNVSSTKIRNLLSLDSDQLSASDQEFLSTSLTDEAAIYIEQNEIYQPVTNQRESKKQIMMNSEQIKDQVVDALEDVKGQDIKVINIADISDFADFMIVVSGTSDTHVKALARTASTNLRELGIKPMSEDGAEIGEWVLVDFGDVVLHVMRPEVREYYDLEKLWDEDVRNMVKQHREKNDA